MKKIKMLHRTRRAGSLVKIGDVLTVEDNDEWAKQMIAAGAAKEIGSPAAEAPKKPQKPAPDSDRSGGN